MEPNPHDHDRTRYTGPEHAKCNRTEGARRGNSHRMNRTVGPKDRKGGKKPTGDAPVKEPQLAPLAEAGVKHRD